MEKWKACIRQEVATRRVRSALEVLDASPDEIQLCRSLGRLFGRVRDAGKMQDVLGRMRDVYTTRELIRRLQVSGGRISDERRLLDAVMTSDCASLHAAYLSRRERLHAICDYTASLTVSRPAARAGRVMLRALPAVGLAALPVVMRRLAAGAAAEPGTA